MTRFKDFMTGEAVPWVSKKDLSRIQAQINKISDQLDTHESKLDVLKNNQSYTKEYNLIKKDIEGAPIASSIFLTAPTS